MRRAITLLVDDDISLQDWLVGMEELHPMINQDVCLFGGGSKISWSVVTKD